MTGLSTAMLPCGSCLLGVQWWLLDSSRCGQTFIFPDSLTLEMVCQGYRTAEAGTAWEGESWEECPLALALGLSHRSYCSSTERRDKTGPRPSVKRCWAGHNCRDLQTPSTIYSLPSHPPQSSQSAPHLSTPLSLQCWSSEWWCQNTTPWFLSTPSASLGTARLSVQVTASGVLIQLNNFTAGVQDPNAPLLNVPQSCTQQKSESWTGSPQT